MSVEVESVPDKLWLGDEPLLAQRIQCRPKVALREWLHNSRVLTHVAVARVQLAYAKESRGLASICRG
ncbi:hypothetical protein PsorP6_006367 [Peronosclerospora sorghi]|uniref:Uncharacterized protein n=1 Tax=Peronosclerospora sorghi TaxID=230839 RepID=A0ACC0W3N1_9STRA|nr:hypothetical protein PsorP6_006367 [Peronosclerospora sorghi]